MRQVFYMADGGGDTARWRCGGEGVCMRTDGKLIQKSISKVQRSFSATFTRHECVCVCMQRTYTFPGAV